MRNVLVLMLAAEHGMRLRRRRLSRSEIQNFEICALVWIARTNLY